MFDILYSYNKKIPEKRKHFFLIVTNLQKNVLFMKKITPLEDPVICIVQGSTV